MIYLHLTKSLVVVLHKKIDCVYRFECRSGPNKSPLYKEADAAQTSSVV